MLAYYFPPLGGGGVQRTLKHVKYLPDMGFDSVVITAGARGYPIRDTALTEEIPPGTVVLRAPSIPMQYARWKLEGMLRAVGASPWRASVVGWPDEMAGWLPAAVFQALRAIRRYRPDVVYTTSSPVTAHLAGLILQSVTGLPWVADFRDAWTLDPHRAREYAPLAQASSALERVVTRRVARAVIVDESVELVGLDNGDDRLVVIRNGVDPDDLAVLPQVADGRFRLSYVGSLYGERDAAPVLAALRHLVSQGTVERDQVELRLVGDGRLDPESTAGVPLSRRPYVDHHEAVAEMGTADALLLYQPSGWNGASGKLYEYLATGRPILCVAPPENFGSRLVAELGAGICVAPEDPAGIERAIEQLYRSWSAGELAPSAEVRAEALRRFSRETLARELADVLDDARRQSPFRG